MITRCTRCTGVPEVPWVQVHSHSAPGALAPEGTQCTKGTLVHPLKLSLVHLAELVLLNLP